MNGTKDRKFLDRRLEIAESDMSDDEKRAALAALKKEMAEWEFSRNAWRKRTLALFAVNVTLCLVVGGALIFSDRVLLSLVALLPLIAQGFYVMWTARY